MELGRVSEKVARAATRVKNVFARDTKPASSSEPEVVDTDDPRARELRIINQQRVEETLSYSFNRPFMDRLKFLRDGLFNNLPVARGDSRTQMRDKDIGSVGDSRRSQINPLNFSAA